MQQFGGPHYRQPAGGWYGGGSSGWSNFWSVLWLVRIGIALFVISIVMFGACVSALNN